MGEGRRAEINTIGKNLFTRGGEKPKQNKEEGKLCEIKLLLSGW